MNKTILLVDDESFILRSLKQLLCEEGYHVLSANSGAKALLLLEKHLIHVVISDERMPLMRGSVFLKQVKALYPDVVRMILSSYLDFDAMKEAINEIGIYKLISKPWQDDVLLQYVQDAFELVIKKKESNLISCEPVDCDPLTGLLNRFSFYKLLSKLTSTEKANHHYFAIAYFDIDRFGNMNVLFGQKKCDYILKELAIRLKNFGSTRIPVVCSNKAPPIIKDEGYVARLGNDEFVVIITDERELSDLPATLEKLYSMIKAPIIIDQKKHHLSVSLGACFYPKHGKTADLLMKYVSVALHHSQQLGGDNYQLYEPYIDETPIFLEDELYEAIEKKQFIIHYQSIYTTDKRKLVGVEALLRWQHPKYGLLLPQHFLSFCEETNLIVPIGAWVLRAACQQIKQWHNLGFPELILTVNFSVRQFNHPRLIELIVDVLETTKFPPSCLELEITETLIMQNPDKVIVLLNMLRELGVLLALDDFGTGYSSLSYLRQFPFTHLKIDRSFIADMMVTGNGKAIVKAIISLGKILGLKVIAEGVETKEQLALLKGKNCDYIQGYLYSKPLAVHELETLLINSVQK